MMISARVLYRPADLPQQGLWEYGWTFCAPSMNVAQGTIDKLAKEWNQRGRRMRYRLAEVLDCDFDHPKNRSRR